MAGADWREATAEGIEDCVGCGELGEIHSLFTYLILF